jgi:hypothetical protein
VVGPPEPKTSVGAISGGGVSAASKLTAIRRASSLGEQRIDRSAVRLLVIVEVAERLSGHVVDDQWHARKHSRRQEAVCGWDTLEIVVISATAPITEQPPFINDALLVRS